MKSVIIDGVKTKGFVDLNHFMRIPCSKRVTLGDVYYYVGYYRGSEFKRIFECVSLDNARLNAKKLIDDVPFQVIIVKSEFKVSVL